MKCGYEEEIGKKNQPVYEDAKRRNDGENTDIKDDYKETGWDIGCADTEGCN